MAVPSISRAPCVVAETPLVAPPDDAE